MGVSFRAQGFDLRRSAVTGGFCRTPQIPALSPEPKPHSLRPPCEDCRSVDDGLDRLPGVVLAVVLCRLERVPDDGFHDVLRTGQEQ